MGIAQFGMSPDTILIGIGNCGRGDDGLGWAFLERVQEKFEFPGQLEYRYQLQVEDAELISRADRVVFIDSYKGALPGGFLWQPCKASANVDFTSHILSAGTVLCLCADLYGKNPPADLLMIQGESWELRNGISPGAQVNLEQALAYFEQKVEPPASRSR